MSATGALPTEKSQPEAEADAGARHKPRRAFRRVAGGIELRLGLLILALTVGFGFLFALNSFAAFGRLYNATLATAPQIFEGEIGAQARAYLYVSAAILAGYLLSVFGVCVAVLNRLLGPTVALERHVRSLKLDDYTSRLKLRAGDSAYNEIARHLNELAERLEERQRKRAGL